MQISPISRVNYNYMNCKKVVKSPSFGSIIADATAENGVTYQLYANLDLNFHKLKLSATRIFRELPTQNAIAKLLNPNEKSEIKVLGCSDGSEVWANAIILKEVMGEKAKQNVKIQGVDKADYIIETAKTGRIVCSDIEKDYARREYEISGVKSPLAGDGWDKYLIKSSRPNEFNQLLEKEPCLQYLEWDPVVRKNIGNGLNWYEINKEGLPNVEFKAGNMLDYLDTDKDTKNAVYVIANAGAYLMENNPNDFIKLFSDIKEKNKGKNVYVVLGSMENMLLNNPYQRLISPSLQYALNLSIKSMGYERIDEKQARSLGIIDYKNTASKILKL